MLGTISRGLDYFLPDSAKANEADRLMARIFVLLHLIGPAMGHAVTAFLWLNSGNSWQFWIVESCVAAFFLVPILFRQIGDIRIPAMVSVQLLVGLSLFGSFYFGGISSPLLPWFLIAMVLGFFYLADHLRSMLTGIGFQLLCFLAARLQFGQFPSQVARETLVEANVISVVAALTYMTIMCLFYEKVMRFSLRLEQETFAERTNILQLRDAMHDAEQASRRKSIFLAKMSHELRTPLNAVIGYSEMLKENWDDDGPDSNKAKDLDRIHAAGRHLLALVNEVIDVSSIESNKQELRLEPVEALRLIDDVVATATPLAQKRGNRLVLNIPEELGTIALDALKIRQSLLNLISNAAKFTTNGMIMLTVLRTQEEGEDYLSFEVTDNGLGMRAEALDRIFENFSQAENDTKSKFGGTGLGLALTKQFCEMMGGDISVRSEYGFGSSFTIRIPVAAQAKREKIGVSA